MRTTVRLLIAVLATASLAAESRAQEGTEVGIRGRITSPNGEGIESALVRAQSDGRVVEARTDVRGDYRLTGAGAGTWTVTVRRLGFAVDSTTVQLTDRLDILSRQLQPLVARAGEQRITESWVGVHGVVGDRGYQPVSGAVIEVVGQTDEVFTTVDGQFALPHKAGESLLLRVRAPGFDPRLVSARIPADGSVEFSVLLDSTGGTVPNEVVADELDRRMSWSSPLALYITRDELLGTDTRDLSLAVNRTPTAIDRNVLVSSGACLFVDGVAKPGMPLASVFPENVEFVEVYVAGAERTGQLGRRWPPRGECGMSGVQGTNVRRVSSARSAQQFVVVWTRKQ